MLPGAVTRGRPNPLHHDFRLRLRRSRRKAGKSASGLSLAAMVDKNAVSRLEAGPGFPRLPMVEQLARVLGCSAAWLAFGLGEQAAPGDGGPLRCAGLGQRVREVRVALGLSMREVDRRAGLSEGGTRYIEGEGMPSLDTLEDLARALGVSPAWLAFGDGPRELPRRGAKPAPAGPVISP